MFPIQAFTTILAFLSFSVHASPLAQRDVVAPPILQPNSSSIWPVGTLQTVIWDTSSLPPTSQITNPIGQIILGFNESNSLNLDFNNPLAKGFRITDGNVTLTVPNVPPRNDYLVVLFGDSGDTSPAFAITQISSGPGTSSSLPDSTTPDTSTNGPTSLSITGSATTAALTAGTPSLSTASLPTATSPTTSSTSTVTSASAASTTTTAASAAWPTHHGSIWSSVTRILIPLVMLFMV